MADCANGGVAAEREPEQPGDASCANIDALFSRLEVLVGEIPKMQELGERLAQARTAAAVLERARELDARERALAEEDGHLAAARDALKAARAAGDESEADRLQRDVLYYGQRRGLRVGPVENGRAALEKALAAGGFATVEDARAVAMGADEMGAAERKIAAYQADYESTLAACRKAQAAE